jgi:RNA polymerase sigma-70 factor (ECF subfamily)
LAHAGDDDAEDRRLLAASGTGDRTAFVRLVARHRGLVARAAARHGLGGADADDVAQEAFSRAWDAAARWSTSDAPFAAWLYRVASNLAIDALRRDKRRRTAPLDAAYEIADPAPGAIAAILEAEVATAVRETLRELPERQRVAVELVHLEGRSAAEAASVLGTSIGALEGLLSRARRGLRVALTRRGLASAADRREDPE